MTHFLKVENISYFIDKEKPILRNISFELNKGEILVFSHPGGLVNIILPSDGVIKPAIIFPKLVFPLPDSPAIPSISPLFNSNEIFLRMGFSLSIKYDIFSTFRK